MTHNDIYTKFMIEYDKANVTSSYPSLTEYEVATVLDKAYHALIAQKVTGNNIRRVALEGDLKSITDLAPLTKVELEHIYHVDANLYSADLPEDYLYFITGVLYWQNKSWVDVAGTGTHDSDFDEKYKFEKAIDQKTLGAARRMPVKLVNHEIANGFIASASNIPWVKTPVCFIENNQVGIVCDSWNHPDANSPGSGFNSFGITYIKTPNKFTKDIHAMQDWLMEKIATQGEEGPDFGHTRFSYFWKEIDPDINWKGDNASAKEANKNEAIKYFDDLYTFECNDTVAEEMISLAVTFALENVESQRLNSKLNMRGLEA